MTILTILYVAMWFVTAFCVMLFLWDFEASPQKYIALGMLAMAAGMVWPFTVTTVILVTTVHYALKPTQEKK